MGKEEKELLRIDMGEGGDVKNSHGERVLLL